MYRLTANRLGFAAGTLVYPCTVYDFGLAEWDSFNCNDEFISVSTQPDGSYPVFTVSTSELENVE